MTSKAVSRPAMKPVAFVILVTVATTLVTFYFNSTLGKSEVVGVPYHSPRWAVILHLVTVLPAVVLGGAILILKKGGRRHRVMGWTWVVLMLATSIASFWIRSPSGGLSAIHLFSIAMLSALPISIWRIRSRDVFTHRQIQLSLYIGLLVAGAFAFAPDRQIGLFLFGG